MAHEGLMVGVSGVRGRVGDALTPEVVARFAAAFGAWAAKEAGSSPGRAKVVLGRDSRVSGPMFHRVVVSALQSVGCDIVDIGMVPTPTVQLAVEHHHAAGGLAITASHNPIEWNALKFIAPSGLFLDAAQGTAMRATLDGEIPRATWDNLGELTEDRDAVARHIERILAIPFLDADAIRRRRFHVALDCVRGAGAVIMPALLDRLGCNVTSINMETDGRFPRAPEPIAENLGELEALVKGRGADVGLAVD
ncbi:MAG: phosphoglucosamine mutase, partial [Gemmatimonadaceae bacterium]|nr:phosphoglucosamine mutase [Gemmatimonadaceae bacterium]